MNCESCGMTIESGPLCQYCKGPDGSLISFDECLERFVDWSMKKGQAKTRPEAEQKSLQYMATMPAWKAHPKVIAANQT